MSENENVKEPEIHEAIASLPLVVAPIRDRVIVRPKKGPEEVGGIFIPEQAREQPHQGTVVAVGDGRVMPNGQIIDMVVKVGDEVLYGRFAGTEVVVNGEPYLMLREDELVATLRVDDGRGNLKYEGEQETKPKAKESEKC